VETLCATRRGPLTAGYLLPPTCVALSSAIMSINQLITGRPLKRVGDSRETSSRSARQRDVILARPNQGRQRLAQTSLDCIVIICSQATSPADLGQTTHAN